MVSLNTASLRRGLETDPWIFVAFPAKGGLPWLILGTHSDTHAADGGPIAGQRFQEEQHRAWPCLEEAEPTPRHGDEM